jgi:hypothetical protein
MHILGVGLVGDNRLPTWERPEHAERPGFRTNRLDQVPYFYITQRVPMNSMGPKPLEPKFNLIMETGETLLGSKWPGTCKDSSSRGLKYLLLSVSTSSFLFSFLSIRNSFAIIV